MNDNKYNVFSYTVTILAFFAFYFFGAFFWTSVGLALFVLSAIRFFNKIGTTIDIRDVIALVPAIQWVVGPWLTYNFSTDTIFYYMSVGEEQYMSFVVPALILFYFGIYINIFKTNTDLTVVLLNIQKSIKYNKNIDILFILVGIIANIGVLYMPPSLMFFIFLTGNLQYVGLFLLFQNKHRKNKKILFWCVLVIMSLLALSRGMFQSLLLWFTFLFIITSFINKTSNLKKTLIILSILVVAFFIQSIKTEFRKVVWATEGTFTDDNKSNSAVFSDLVSERINRTELLTSEENINNIIGRINQGWIIARVMKHTPTFEPFAKGETIIDGITATLLPRFLNENKVKSGDQTNFTRFTGRKLLPGTSMGISTIGEAYANFGKSGAIIFMFFFGFFLNIVHTLIISSLKVKPILLFFIPLIFLQVVKAESNFVIVLNHLVKATIFVFLLLWGLKVFFNIKNL